MGTDIHAAIEFKTTSGWQAILTENRWYGSWEGGEEYTACLSIDRNYNLFSILGNVRNGAGFAGIDTGDAFFPLSDHRGVPPDISLDAASALSGDHSATFVLLSEMLVYDWTQVIKHRGIVNGPQLSEWERLRKYGLSKGPKSYCGGASGPGVVHTSYDNLKEMLDNITKQHKDSWQGKQDAGAEITKNLGSTYCKVEWETTYAECVPQFWAEVFPIMLKLGNQYGYENVRLVMNFDS